jgi:D-xylose transport system permease protein
VLPAHLEAVRLVFLSAVIGLFALIMAVYLGIPWSVVLLLALAVLFSFVAGDTTFGRHLYAIGGNPDAARLSGIDVPRNTFALFMVMGVMTAIAGIVYTSRLNAATTSAGQNAELDAIAAAVIGGTSLLGGEGTIFGAIVGALVMASLDNGMSLMNLDITFQYVIKGLILLLAVWVDMAQRKK